MPPRLRAGLELCRRPDFERDVRAALATAHAEWHDRMESELARAVDVWVDDAVQLAANAIPQFSPRDRACVSANDTDGHRSPGPAHGNRQQDQ